MLGSSRVDDRYLLKSLQMTGRAAASEPMVDLGHSQQQVRRNYFAGGLPASQEDFSFFVASAMPLRLDRLLARPDGKREPNVEAILERCDNSLL